MIILPSLLAAPSLTLKQSIEDLLNEGFYTFHIDMMDYHFTNNFGLTPQICEDILATFPEITLDVHLMTNPTPIALIEQLTELGIHHISVHQETLSTTPANARVALCPGDPTPNHNKLLFLTVPPGFSHQTLQPAVLEKASLAKQRGANIMIDGGINLQTLDSVLAIQPDAIVIGGGLFNPERKEMICRLKDLPNSTFRY